MYSQYKDKIIGFYQKHKRMPAYQEIMDLLGFKSKNAVSKLVAKLVDDGVVNKDQKGRLSPSRLFGEIPIHGKLPVTLPGIAKRGDGVDREAWASAIR